MSQYAYHISSCLLVHARFPYEISYFVQTLGGILFYYDRIVICISVDMLQVSLWHTSYRVSIHARCPYEMSHCVQTLGGILVLTC